LCASSSGTLTYVTVNPEIQLATLHKFMKFVTNLPPEIGYWISKTTFVLDVDSMEMKGHEFQNIDTQVSVAWKEGKEDLV